MQTETFEQQVIERSHELPVLVDFWAEWCGPCRILGPVLETLAQEQAGKWELVKIDTESSPELSQRFQIRSIPAVKLFHQGEVIGEFMGALPKSQIERWLQQHLPDKRQALLEVILQKGDPSDQQEALETFVKQHPDFPAARIALAHRYIFSEPERVPAILDAGHFGADTFDAANDLRTLHELMTTTLDDSPAGQSLLQARQFLSQMEHDAALQQVIQAVMQNKTYHQDLPRRVAIALFRFFGPASPLTKKFRRQFDMALY